MSALGSRVVRVAALVALLAGAGCGPSGLEIEVVFPTDLGIDQLVFALSAEDAEPVAPVAAPEEPALLDSGSESAVFLLPDDMLDKDVSIVIEGLAAGRAVASGVGSATSKAGALVGVSIALDPSPLGCGNALLEIADEDEACDDGNTANGDGCSSQCLLEDGFACEGTAEGETTSCAPVCADGLVRGAELLASGCDDGGAVNGDGCDGACAVESGWLCAGEPSACTPVCGDGVLLGGEPCDDGNTDDDDGCSAACALEQGWLCDAAEPTTCAPVCGDGLVRGAELCDDAGTASDDGCSDACAPEGGFTCDAAEPTACAPTCGDGLLRGGEPCDDGAAGDGDGCSAGCALESGWLCDGAEPTSCAPLCGDGLVRPGEQCDDGDTAGGDGCDDACSEEPGFTCDAAEPSACGPTCGDGLLLGGEPCDDAGTGDGDGCSAVCTLEAGFTCDGAAPTTCAPVCGDGLLRLGEACDDGGVDGGDGCDSACVVETGFTCDAAQPTACAPICGDALVLGGEACDLGADPLAGNSDTRPDACRTDCTNPRCGDFVADPALGEGCDDGNTNNRDGCLTACALASCGDGFKNAPEACDDGDVDALDGCSDTCTIEAGFLCGGEPSVCALDAVGHRVGGGGADFATISAAVSSGSVLNGHTLFLAAVTFNERVEIANKDLTLVAEPGAVLTDAANGSGQTFLVSSGRVVVVRNLAIQNTSLNARGPVVLEDAGTAVTFAGCRIGPSREVGIDAPAGTNVTLTRSTVTGNTLGGVDLGGGFFVENSVLVGNGSAGSTGGARLAGAGTFQFNTVSGNLSTGGGVQCVAANAVTSSIVFGNSGAQVSAGCNAGTSHLVDPDFAADGFHIDPGSPAIDRTAVCPVVDFDGDARPINGSCELGADERP